MGERGRGENTKKKKERRTPATRREKKNPGGKRWKTDARIDDDGARGAGGDSTD